MIPMTRHAFAGVLLVSTIAAGGCQSKAAATAGHTTGKQVDPATAGSISGIVTFSGSRPAPEFLKMGSDEACVMASGPNPRNDAILIGKGGALQNVFVYIKDGLDPSYTFDVPATPVRLDQKGCRYEPRVIGTRVGQQVELMNDDATMHNVHAMPIVNQEFSQSLIMQGSRMLQTFTAPEVMVKLKCSMHGWMTGWIGVVAHPFFAVTAADGSFSFKGVPPGTYTIEAWHERFGTRTAKITLGVKDTHTVPFSFTATAQPAALDKTTS
jgi:plastocyanin